MRQKLDIVELKSMADGYEFNLSGRNYLLRFDSGAWRLLPTEMPDESALFESFNEAMHFALDGGLDS